MLHAGELLLHDVCPLVTNSVLLSAPVHTLAVQLALVELQQRVLPSVEALKSSLEERHRLVRGPTPIERLDFITTMARWAQREQQGWCVCVCVVCFEQLGHASCCRLLQ